MENHRGVCSVYMNIGLVIQKNEYIDNQICEKCERMYANATFQSITFPQYLEFYRIYRFPTNAN